MQSTQTNLIHSLNLVVSTAWSSRIDSEWFSISESFVHSTYIAQSLSWVDLINVTRMYEFIIIIIIILLFYYFLFIWFDLIWFEFIHSCDIDLSSIHERNYAMYIEWTKFSEKENRSSTTWWLHVVETIKLTLCYQ